MDLGLRGKRALITGSTGGIGGIGYAINEGPVREGAAVWLTGRSQDSVDAALARLRQAVPGASAGGTVADCATADGASLVFAALPAVDILVNILGLYARCAAFDITDAAMRVDGGTVNQIM